MEFKCLRKGPSLHMQIRKQIVGFLEFSSIEPFLTKLGTMNPGVNGNQFFFQMKFHTPFYE